MTNPYEAFDISDDEQDQFVGGKQQTDKVRKTHKERRQMKKIGTEPTKPVGEVNSDIPARVRDNAKQVRHNYKEHSGKPFKGIPQGHTLDRRSGTGRDDRPRKGRGYVGTVQDELKARPEQGAVTAPVEQTTEVPQEQQKPEEPEKLTLAEYYQAKGVDLNLAAQKKAPVKGQVNAEWLKKEKLTLIETKEDKRKQENIKQSVLIHNNTRVEMGLENADRLGFGTKPAPKQREQEPQREQQNDRGYKGKKTQSKVALKEEDFPSL